MLGLPPRNGQWTAGLNHFVLRNDLTLTLFNNVIMVFGYVGQSTRKK